MEYTVVMKFRGRYEAIRIEEDSAVKAAFSAAKSSSFHNKSLFVGCFTNNEMSCFIQERAGKSTTRNRLNMLIEESTSDVLNTNTIQLSSINGDITCEEDVLKNIFLEFTRRRKVIRVILGETLPTIKLEAYDHDGYDAHIHMTI